MKTTIIKKVSAYNPDTEESVNDRRIFGGNPPTDLNMNKIRYKWAVSLIEVMQKCTWFITESSIVEDRKDYRGLTEYEKEMYDKAFSQIVMMDTFQSANISENVLPFCSAPEVRVCLSRHAWEESLHSLTYATIANTISPDSDEVFERYKTDERLRAKNDKIAKVFERLSTVTDEESYYLGLIANQVLEGIFFKSAFISFFSLAMGGKMRGTASLIKFISRDEDNHLTLIKNMITATHREKPYLLNDKEVRAKAMDIITSAVELEIAWASYITSGKVLGLSDTLMSKYIKYLASDICKNINFEIPYPEEYSAGNPISWAEGFDPNEAKANFFEGNVTDYSQGSIGFDDL